MHPILNDLVKRYPELAACAAAIQKAADLLTAAYLQGGKILLCGNGGSAADCEHIAGELMKGFVLPRPLTKEQKEDILKAGGSNHMASALQGALPAISLCGHPSLATAFINDVDAALVFAQQVWGLGNKGDALIAISTSGNAENVLNAAIAARAKGLYVLGLTGESGGKLDALCDVCLKAPAAKTYEVQEYHLPVYHALCLILEQAFFS